MAGEGVRAWFLGRSGGETDVRVERVGGRGGAVEAPVFVEVDVGHGEGFVGAGEESAWVFGKRQGGGGEIQSEDVG